VRAVMFATVCVCACVCCSTLARTRSRAPACPAPRVCPHTRSPAKFPKELLPTQVYVDRESSCVFIPINGVHTPFHVATIKSVSTLDDMESHQTFLRLNFACPGATVKDTAPAMRRAVDENPALTYIKMLSLRAKVRACLCAPACACVRLC
jgi:nucleosome binding factor SPN SPT16 subunit